MSKQLIFFDPTFRDESLHYQVEKLIEGTDFIPTGYAKKCTTRHFVEAINNAYQNGVTSLATVLDTEEFWKQYQNEELFKATDRLFESFEIFKSQGQLHRIREALSVNSAEDLTQALQMFISPKEYLKFLVVSVLYNLTAFETTNKEKNLPDPFPQEVRRKATTVLSNLKDIPNFQSILQEDSQLAKIFVDNTRNSILNYGAKFYTAADKLLKPEHLREGGAWLVVVSQQLQKNNFINSFQTEILENKIVQDYLKWKPGSGTSSLGSVDKTKLAVHEDGCFHVYIVSLNLPTKGAAEGFKQLIKLKSNNLVMVAGPRSTDWNTLVQQYGTLMNPNIQFGVLKKMSGMNNMDITNLLSIRIYDKAKFYEDITEMMGKTFSNQGDKVKIFISSGITSLLGENDQNIVNQIQTNLTKNQNTAFGGQINFFGTPKASSSLYSLPNKGLSVEVAKIIDTIINETIEEKDEKKVAEKSAYAWLVKYSKDFIEATKEKQEQGGWGEEKDTTLDKQKKTQKENNKNQKQQNGKGEQEEENTNKSKASGNQEEVEKKKQAMVRRLEAFSASKYKWVAFMIASIQLQKAQGLLEKDKDKKEIDLSILNALVREADKEMASEYLRQLGGEIFLEMYKHLKKFHDQLKKQLKDAQKVVDEDKKKSEEEKILLKIGTHEAFFGGSDTNPKFLLDKYFEAGAY